MNFRVAALFALLAGSPPVVAPAWAQAIASGAVGAVDVTIKGNSDTVLAVPLAGRPEFLGRVATAGAVTGGFALNVSVATSWTTNQFARLFYVRFTSGARNGMYYTVTANTTARLVVDAAGDDLSGVAAGDTFALVRHWTLDRLFPPAVAGTNPNPLGASADFSPAQRKSEILLPDTVSTGINLPPASRYFFTAANGWVADTAGRPSAANAILAPDSLFIVRQPASLPVDVTWVACGSVVATDLVIPLATQAAGKQDNAVGLLRPVAVRLADAGLESGFVDSLGFAGNQRRDSLLLFDNARASHNKSAAKSFFRVNGVWYSDATGNPVANDERIAAGAGFVVRKFSQAAAATGWWTNSPGY